MIYWLRICAGWIGLIWLSVSLVCFLQAMRDLATGPSIPRVLGRRTIRSRKRGCGYEDRR